MDHPAERSTHLARERLRATGARVTSARIQVLAALIDAAQALTHHDLEVRMPTPLDRVTLYRVLDWLVANGLSHRAAGEDRVWRFMAGEPHAGHAHFHCNRCGAVTCLDDTVARNVRVPRGFRRDAVELTVRGRCARCAQATR